MSRIPRSVAGAFAASVLLGAPTASAISLEEAERELTGVTSVRITIPRTVDLAESAGEVLGAQAGDGLGAHATGGDINGDGVGDLVAAGTSRGFVVGGPLMAPDDLSSREPAFAFSSSGSSGGGLESEDVIGGVDTGDVNGDGKGDVLFGKPNEDTDVADNGRAYVIFGKAAATDVVASPAGFSEGFVIEGGGLARAGADVAALGDLNGDGRQEVIVGAPGANKAFVVFGKADTATVQLDNLGAGGFEMASADIHDPGSLFQDVGASVAAAGDVNDDGLPDILLGAPSSGTDAGAAIVVFGKATTSAVNLDSLGRAGYYMDTDDLGSSVGYAVANAGDVNGDGRPDQIVGGIQAGDGIEGAAYVVFGQARFATVDLDALGSSGYKLEGAELHDRTGAAVAGGRDLNGDGRSDVVVGAPEYNVGSEGGTPRAYVVYGKSTRRTVDLGGLTSDEGFVLAGAAGTFAGSAVDITRQLAGETGGSDILVGARNDAGSSSRPGAGTVYVVDEGTAPDPVLQDATFDLPSASKGGLRSALARAAARRRRGGRLTFRLRRPARVTVRQRRMLRGRRVRVGAGQDCRAAARARRAPACTRLVRAMTMRRTFRRPGRQRIDLGRSLPAGFYVIDVMAREPSGRTSGPGRAVIPLR